MTAPRPTLVRVLHELPGWGEFGVSSNDARQRFELIVQFDDRDGSGELIGEVRIGFPAPRAVIDCWYPTPSAYFTKDFTFNEMANPKRDASPNAVYIDHCQVWDLGETELVLSRKDSEFERGRNIVHHYIYFWDSGVAYQVLSDPAEFEVVRYGDE